MRIIDRFFQGSELQQAPPVLVDVGASEAVPAAWSRIARHSIAVGFEPDRREIASLAAAQKQFRRWIFSDRLIVAGESVTETKLYLTKSPYCSSTLPPNEPALAEWSFAGYFETVETRNARAATLMQVLREHRLEHLDWLKCDTQGTDLRIFLSLPPEQRRRVLVVEFEPGLIDAYQGEDKFAAILGAMESEPYWLAALGVEGVPWGTRLMYQRQLGDFWGRGYRLLGPTAPGWVNAVYVRRFSPNDGLDKRAYLLGSVLACLVGQPAYGLEVAEAGARKFDDGVFAELRNFAASEMRRTVLRRWREWPGIAWHKLWKR